MAKGGVLGNDPFQRGAAVREPAAATKPEPAPARASKPGPERTGARKPRAARATPEPRPPVDAEPAAPEAARAEPDVAAAPPIVREPAADRPSGLSALARALAARAMASPAVQRALGAMFTSPAFARALTIASRGVEAARAAPFAGAVRALLPQARDAVSAAASGRTAGSIVSTVLSAAEAARRFALVRTPPGDVDEFGEDPSVVERVTPALDFLYDRYWRVRVEGAANVPAGACLVVCNHSGALPFDGPMMRTALRREARRPDARWLVEDAIAHAPFLGVYLSRVGAVRACPENAEKLLERGAAVVVFPEGVHGMGKVTVGFAGGERYRVGRFGRGGFVKLALRTGVPIVPAAIVGAEEAAPLVARIPTKALGLSYLPVTPTFPFLGPLGLLPLPSRWSMQFLPAVDVSAHGAGAVNDQALVQKLTEDVRGSIQAALDQMVAARRSVFFG